MTGAHREPPGSVAEEAARLLAALQERVGPAPRPDAAGAAAECRYCPVCQALAAVRSTNPEVTEHLVAAASELVDAWRAVRTPRPARDPAASGEGTGDTASRPRDTASGPGDTAPAEETDATPVDDAAAEPPPPGDGGDTRRRRPRGIQHIDVR